MRLKQNELVWNPGKDAAAILILKPGQKAPKTVEEWEVLQAEMLRRAYKEADKEEKRLAEIQWAERPGTMLEETFNLKMSDPEFPEKVMQLRWTDEDAESYHEWKMKVEERILENPNHQPHKPSQDEINLLMKDRHLVYYIEVITF